MDNPNGTDGRSILRHYFFLFKYQPHKDKDFEKAFESFEKSISSNADLEEILRTYAVKCADWWEGL